jgi:hypothetical protein
MNRHGAIELAELTGRKPNTAAMIGEEVPLFYVSSSQIQADGGARLFDW